MSRSIKPSIWDESAGVVGNLKGGSKRYSRMSIMGYVRVKADIANPVNRSMKVAVDCLVDTGAIYTMIPRAFLEKIQTETTGARRFKLANGNVEEFPVGEAYIDVEGIGATSLVVFGSENSHPLLGVTTLELLGLQVNPLSGELKPLDLYLLSWSSTLKTDAPTTQSTKEICTNLGEKTDTQITTS